MMSPTSTWLYRARPIDEASGSKKWIVQVLRPGATESEYTSFDTEAEARAFQHQQVDSTLGGD